MVKCSNKIIQFIKKIDYFGTFITFRVNDHFEYKSIIGGTFTLIYALFAFGYILTLSISFIKRKNIDFIYSYKIMSNPFINLTNIKFIFSFGIQYSKNSLSAINDTSLYFNYSIQLIEWVGTDNITFKSLNYKKCDLSDFPNLEMIYNMNDIDDISH